ncbi:unnamed protein product [Parnassius mnemosyne]|uniref:Uncharacterized protein n=1 Tax=Parnassius mnemosyne TaxID=213953 RepID=A0AAV1L1E3_9NEOP
MNRQRATERLQRNQRKQDTYVNQRRNPPRGFELNSLVFVRKQSQATGKLDSCMRGPYRVVNVLPYGRYELQLVAGSYGKTTQAAAEYMVPWRGEWTPEVCAAYFEDADIEGEESTAEESQLVKGQSPRPKPLDAVGLGQDVEEEQQTETSRIERPSAPTPRAYVTSYNDEPSPSASPVIDATPALFGPSDEADIQREREPDDGLLSGEAV